MFTRLKSFFASRPGAAAAPAVHPRALGDASVEQGRMDDAAAHYRNALSLDPRDLAACIGLGFALCELQQHAQAKPWLLQALSIDPDAADAHYLLGGVARRANDNARAVEQFTRTLQLQPGHVFAHRERLQVLVADAQHQSAWDAVTQALTQFGDIAEFLFYQGHLLSLQGAQDAAITSYRKALAVQPDAPAPHLPLAHALAQQGQWEAALAHYQQAAHHQPDQASIQVALGSALEKRGRRSEAITCYRRAVALDPAFGLAHYHLGNALLNQGDKLQARACFENVLRLDPGNPVGHLVAALSGQATDGPPSEYVRRLFDEYAERFDTHLVQVLQYHIPQELAALLLSWRTAASPPWDLLDLGCGTGLLGASLTEATRQRVGVDLSTNMLDKARARQVYQRLEHQDLLQMMQGEAPAAYDVVASTDVFIYVGRLDAVVAQAQRILRPGGLFAFSVESLDALPDLAAATQTRGFQLNPTGRYAHGRSHLENLARLHGFEVLAVRDTQCRMESGQGVAGYLMVWRRCDAHRSMATPDPT